MPSADAILAELQRRRDEQQRAADARPKTLEELLTDSRYFGLVTASPLQRAVCRIIDGLPLGPLAELEVVRNAVGGAVSALPQTRPDEVALLSAIRCGKSLIAAALALEASQICDLRGLGPGEVPRYSIVSVHIDLARVILAHLVGNIMAKPELRRLLIGEPTSDSVIIRHPSGRPVEIKIVAGATAGATLVARWSAGCAFDEAPRMIGAEAGAINLDHMRSAVLGRLLPGAQIAYIGSPWAPTGPVYQMVLENFGRPSRAMVVMKAPGRDMRPDYWTAERSEKLRKHDADVHRTDCLAEFADLESALLSSIDVERCMRTVRDLPRVWGQSYVAAMDPGTRGNSWTLVVGTRTTATVLWRDPKTGVEVQRVTPKLQIVMARQWTGSKAAPLSPRKVLAEQAEVLQLYGLREAWSDQYSGDALRDLAAECGLSLLLSVADERKKLARYKSLATRVADVQLDLPPDPYVRSDLLGIRKRVTQTGIQIVLPKTADGRHCDYAPAITLALSLYLDEPDATVVEPPKPGTPAWAVLEAAREEREDEEAVLAAERREYWEDDG